MSGDKEYDFFGRVVVREKKKPESQWVFGVLFWIVLIVVIRACSAS